MIRLQTTFYINSAVAKLGKASDFGSDTAGSNPAGAATKRRIINGL